MFQPFIKLFKSPYAYYVFDVNRNDLVPVEKDVYKALQDIMNGKENSVSRESWRKISLLKGQGYLSEKRVKKVLNYDSKWLSYYLENQMARITLQVTQNCNLRCGYCVYGDANPLQRTHSNRSMDFETAKQAVLFLRDRSKDSREITISFYGGEPLLEFPLIKRVVNYCEKVFLGKKVMYTITTNGTLFTDEIIHFLDEYNFYVTVSLDGEKKAHDLNRRFASNGKGSYDVIIKNLRHIYEVNPVFANKINLSMVIDPDISTASFEQLREHLPFINWSDSAATVVDDTYSEEKNYYSEEFIKKNTYDTFLAFLNTFKEVNDSYVSVLAKGVMDNIGKVIRGMGSQNELPDEIGHGGPCMPGKKRPLIAVNGDIFPCERVSETVDHMKIGSIFTGFDLSKVNALFNIGAETEEKCKNCWNFMQCTICCRVVDREESFCPQSIAAYCNEVKEATANTIQQIIAIKDISNHQGFPVLL